MSSNNKLFEIIKKTSNKFSNVDLSEFLVKAGTSKMYTLNLQSRYFPNVVYRIPKEAYVYEESIAHVKGGIHENTNEYERKLNKDAFGERGDIKIEVESKASIKQGSTEDFLNTVLDLAEYFLTHQDVLAKFIHYATAEDLVTLALTGKLYSVQIKQGIKYIPLEIRRKIDEYGNVGIDTNLKEANRIVADGGTLINKTMKDELIRLGIIVTDANKAKSYKYGDIQPYDGKSKVYMLGGFTVVGKISNVSQPKTDTVIWLVQSDGITMPSIVGSLRISVKKHNSSSIEGGNIDTKINKYLKLDGDQQFKKGDMLKVLAEIPNAKKYIEINSKNNNEVIAKVSYLKNADKKSSANVLRGINIIDFVKKQKKLKTDDEALYYATQFLTGDMTSYLGDIDTVETEANCFFKFKNKANENLERALLSFNTSTGKNLKNAISNDSIILFKEGLSKNNMDKLLLKDYTFNAEGIRSMLKKVYIYPVKKQTSKSDTLYKNIHKYKILLLPPGNNNAITINAGFRSKDNMAKMIHGAIKRRATTGISKILDKNLYIRIDDEKITVYINYAIISNRVRLNNKVTYYNLLEIKLSSTDYGIKGIYKANINNKNIVIAMDVDTTIKKEYTSNPIEAKIKDPNIEMDSSTIYLEGQVPNPLIQYIAEEAKKKLEKVRGQDKIKIK
jgi:hypothetical protein